jgi:hypothetical protein
MANVDLVPTRVFERRGPIFVPINHLRSDVSVTAQLPGINGRIGLLVEAQGFGQVLRSDTLNIASFSVPAPAPITLLGPLSYQLF